MKKKKSLEQYVAGTPETGVAGAGAMGGMGSLYTQIPGILDSIIGAIENNPKAYSKQPTVNAGIMRNMVSPYAFGGDVDLGEDELAQLQQIADDNNMTIDEVVAKLQGQDMEEIVDPDIYEPDSDEDDSEGDGFAYGGRVRNGRNPFKRNKLNLPQNTKEWNRRGYALGTGLDGIDDGGKKKKGKKNNTPVPNNYGIYNGIIDENGKAVDVPTHTQAVETMIKYMLNNKPGEFVDDGSNVYRPEFQHHSIITKPMKPIAAFGMQVGKGLKPIEVEDDEVVETPDGKVQQMQGKTHEEGGIDIAVPKGTKIFSDRLQVDGKTMQERKIAREKTESRIRKAMAKNPTDALLKNSLTRTLEVNQMEEAKDMQIQTVVNAIANNTPEKFTYGGYGYDEGDPEYPFVGPPNIKFGRNRVGRNFMQNTTITPGTTMPSSITSPPSSVDGFHNDPNFLGGLNPSNPEYVDPSLPRVDDKPYVPGAKVVAPTEESNAMNLTAGDWIGLSGNTFNAIAPLVNTIKSAQSDKPNINRYRGFGRKAIEANDVAMGLAAKTKSAALTNLNTSRGSAYLRNRNSAMGVNTIRNLDIATDVNADQAASNIDNSYVKEMIGLLGLRGNLENAKDSAEMRGATMVDQENKKDKDNFYSNVAANLTNMGTNVQGIGRNLNKAESNRVNMNLLSQLSQYGLGFDKNGKLITINK